MAFTADPDLDLSLFGLANWREDDPAFFNPTRAWSSQVRSGVRRLRVIDFDQVSLSSLNRHAVATWGDVGYPKVLYGVASRRQGVVVWSFSCLMQLASGSVGIFDAATAYS